MGQLAHDRRVRHLEGEHETEEEEELDDREPTGDQQQPTDHNPHPTRLAHGAAA